MQAITYLTPSFAVTAELSPEDFAAAAALGFKSVVSHRPDGEEPGQLAAREEAELAARAGLAFRHVPATKFDLFTNEVVGGTLAALSGLEGPVLAHCKSGLRSAIAWAAAEARSRPVDEVLGRIKAAGMDLDFLRDEFEMQADQEHWAPTAVAAAGPTGRTEAA